MQVKNLAEKHPDVVARLSEQVLEWRATLPAGRIDPGAGMPDLPWPGTSSAKEKKAKKKVD